MKRTLPENSRVIIDPCCPSGYHETVNIVSDGDAFTAVIIK
jgi:hypothetical protein